MSKRNKNCRCEIGKVEDNFIFDFNEIRGKIDVISLKCSIVEPIASICYRLGLLCPIVVQMKIFFQKLFSAKWDDLITNDYLE